MRTCSWVPSRFGASESTKQIQLTSKSEIKLWSDGWGEWHCQVLCYIIQLFNGCTLNSINNPWHTENTNCWKQVQAKTSVGVNTMQRRPRQRAKHFRVLTLDKVQWVTERELRGFQVLAGLLQKLVNSWQAQTNQILWGEIDFCKEICGSNQTPGNSQLAAAYTC